MELSLKQKSDILKKVKEKEKNIYKNFSFLNLTIEERELLFNKIVNTLLDKSNISSINNLLKKIDIYYNYELKKTFKSKLNDDNINIYLKEYTNNYFNKKVNIEELLISYSEDLLFLLPNISFEDYNYLLENTSLCELIEKVIYYRNKLNMKKIEALLQTNLFPILDLYCEKNNITIEEIEEVQNSDSFSFTGDSVRDYVNNLPATLPEEEQEKCLIAISKGDNSLKNYIVEHNMRLVASVANKYKNTGIPLNDLIQEGSFGLMKAVDRYDINKGFRFSTYAIWWIRQAMTRAIADYGRTIRLPVYFTEEINKFNRIKDNLSTELGRDATKEEIAEKMGITVEKVEEIIKGSFNVVSYNVDVSNDDSKEETEMIEFIPDDIDIERSYLQKDLAQHVNNSLNILKDRERQVLIHRFGLFGVRKKSLEEVGNMFNLTRERIRQIEAKSLKKLKNNSEVRQLISYLDRKMPLDEGNTLYSYFNAPRRYLYQAIDLLESDEKVFLQNLYGENFDEKAIINTTEQHNYIISKLRIFLRAYMKPENVSVIRDSLCLILNTNLEELHILINDLNEKDANIIYLKYKDGLDKPSPNILDLPLEHYFTREILRKLIKIQKEKDTVKEKVLKKNS